MLHLRHAHPPPPLFLLYALISGCANPLTKSGTQLPIWQSMTPAGRTEGWREERGATVRGENWEKGMRMWGYIVNTWWCLVWRRKSLQVTALYTLKEEEDEERSEWGICERQRAVKWSGTTQRHDDLFFFTLQRKKKSIDPLVSLRRKRITHSGRLEWGVATELCHY